jgi:predicted membrane-bound spermidine synthase
MLETETIDRATVDGDEFVLARHDGDWVVRVNSRMLMSSRMHASEEALAEHALELFRAPRAVLVGGLGLGFTLRAVLDRVSSDAVVTVAELVPELVGWNRKQLAELNDRPLEDPRCEVVVGDVFETVKRSRGAFDVILLDVDNGPIALSNARNQRLTTRRRARRVVVGTQRSLRAPLCGRGLRRGSDARSSSTRRARTARAVPRRAALVEASTLLGSVAKALVRAFADAGL